MAENQLIPVTLQPINQIISFNSLIISFVDKIFYFKIDGLDLETAKNGLIIDYVIKISKNNNKNNWQEITKGQIISGYKLIKKWVGTTITINNCWDYKITLEFKVNKNIVFGIKGGFE